MKRFIFVIFLLISMVLASLSLLGKPYKTRTIIDLFTSDSDTVLVSRAGLGSDSVFIIGGIERGISIQLWGALYGDSGIIRVIWYYGNDRSIMLAETLLDTSLANGDTINKILDITNYKYKWGSFLIEDSIDPTAGDSISLWLIEYDQ